jgi:hypothetical protein
MVKLSLYFLDELATDNTLGRLTTTLEVGAMIGYGLSMASVIAFLVLVSLV